MAAIYPFDLRVQAAVFPALESEISNQQSAISP
jgi:hypothetical protein